MTSPARKKPAAARNQPQSKRYSGPVTAHAIAKATANTVGGARHTAYGNPTFGLDRVAAIWNGILRAADKPPAKPLNGFDVAQLMVGLKMARGYTGPHRPDNAIDQAGWSAVGGEVAARMARKRR